MKFHVGQNKPFDLVLSPPNSFTLALTPYLLAGSSLMGRSGDGGGGCGRSSEFVPAINIILYRRKQ